MVEAVVAECYQRNAYTSISGIYLCSIKTLICFLWLTYLDLKALWIYSCELPIENELWIILIFNHDSFWVNAAERGSVVDNSIFSPKWVIRREKKSCLHLDRRGSSRSWSSDSIWTSYDAIVNSQSCWRFILRFEIMSCIEIWNVVFKYH